MYDYRTDPFVSRTVEAVRALYGDRLKGLLLYGSRARGDVHDESDYDYLVLLDPPFDYAQERKQLSQLSHDLLMETGEWAYFRPEPPDALELRTAFMWNVRQDAVPLHA